MEIDQWPEIDESAAITRVELLLDFSKVERRPEEGDYLGLGLLTVEADGVGLVEVEENIFLIFSKRSNTLIVVEVKG